jgi:hypothetical protein
MDKIVAARKLLEGIDDSAIEEAMAERGMVWVPPLHDWFPRDSEEAREYALLLAWNASQPRKVECE